MAASIMVGEDGRVHMDGAHAVRRTLPAFSPSARTTNASGASNTFAAFARLASPSSLVTWRDAHRLAVRGGQRDANPLRR